MELQCYTNKLLSIALDLSGKSTVRDMTRQNALINSSQRVHSWEADSKHTEVSLKTWIDGEASSSGIHACNILHIVYFLQQHFLTIIPMIVVQMLVNENTSRIAPKQDTIPSDLPV